MIRRIVALFLCTALCLMLCSCSNVQNVSDSEARITLPEPTDAPVNMFLGEQFASEPESVTLHYVSSDSTSFTTVTRSIIVSPGENIYEESIKALLNTSGMSDRNALIPLDTHLIDIEYSCGIVTVNLSLDAHGTHSDQEYLMLAASIVNTLLTIDGVEGVNVLIDGRSEGIIDLPMGVRTQPYTGITPEYAQISAERDYFLDSAIGTIVREAVLYFPTKDGGWFVPELREIAFDSDNYAAALIRALRSGPQRESAAVTAIPESADLLTDNPTFEITASGESVLRLDFSSTLLNYLAFSGLEDWQLIGSIALTVCSFVPEADAVRIYIDDHLVTHYSIEDEEYTFENGLIRRSDFSSLIGNTYTVYVPGESDSLESVERAGSILRTESPQSLLDTLMDVFSENTFLSASFTDNVYRDDILGVSVEEGIASVNLSANFYRQAQAFDAAEERSVVYAIINTLCELDGITGVQFYIEGISAETLAGDVYLKGVLLPNPGIIVQTQPEITEFTAQP